MKNKKIDAYKRWFADDWDKKEFKALKFTKEEIELFDNEEYKIYKQSPEHHLSGGYFYLKVTDVENDDDNGKLVEKLILSMVWGAEGERQDFGDCCFDRTNKKFIYED